MTGSASSGTWSPPFWCISTRSAPPSMSRADLMRGDEWPQDQIHPGPVRRRTDSRWLLSRTAHQCEIRQERACGECWRAALVDLFEPYSASVAAIVFSRSGTLAAAMRLKGSRSWPSRSSVSSVAAATSRGPSTHLRKDKRRAEADQDETAWRGPFHAVPQARRRPPSFRQRANHSAGVAAMVLPGSGGTEAAAVSGARLSTNRKPATSA
jgi:hypothetical protein